jgi:spore coat protein CotF
MMKPGIREAMEMFEMLRDSACMIDHYTDYINHCQDPQLRQILEIQQRRMVDNYQQKVNVIQGHGLDITNAPRFNSAVNMQVQAAGMAGMQGSTGVTGAQGSTGMYGGANIQFGIQQPGMQAQQQGQQQSPQQTQYRVLSDRTIAQGALMFHKCGAARATTAALESAEPHLRNLAANSARACMDMAYELFRYMDQKGWYQMPEMPRNFVNHMQAAGTQIYPGIHQGYQTGVQGMPGQLS